MTKQNSPTVAILDAGAQYGKLIDRRARNLGVHSEVLPLSTKAEDLKRYEAIIISGGPESVYSEDAPDYDPAVFEMGKPILGICYGMQLMNKVSGGEVKKLDRREDGPTDIKIIESSPIFKGLSQQERVLMSHGDSIVKTGDGFSITAKSGDIVAAIENTEIKQFGMQFHPEVEISTNGTKMLEHFLFDVAGVEASFTLKNRETDAIDEIQKTVGDKNVLILASGGVDSTVTAALVEKALKPEQIHIVHVDSGFMREGESKFVKEALGKAGIDLRVIEAEDDFLNATIDNDQSSPPLRSVIDPEVKRQIIGDTFMNVTNKAIEGMGLKPEDTFLAQGTLRPDLIESASKLASGNAQTIKTHHNDTALVRKLRDQGRVIEPLKDLHKDEVRELAVGLGLSEELAWRQPFPGPGLAIRIICADKPDIDSAAKRTESELKNKFENGEVSVNLLPVRTVGVQGDGRSYGRLVALSGKADWPKLIPMAQEIPRQVHGVNRIVYLFGSKLDGPVHDITPTTLEPEVIDQLRKADHAVNEILAKHGLNRSLSQVPVVLFPVNFGKDGSRAIGIRTIITSDFMTGDIATPGEQMPIQVLDEIVEAVLAVPGISRVAYDLTSKPPATTEWE